MSRLAHRLQLAMDQLNLSGRAIEQLAGLPHMTVSGIMADRHPRSERMAKLLAALPAPTAHDLLIAYLLDDCPTEWVERVTILIEDGHSSSSGLLQEEPATYRTRITPATQARQVLADMAAALDAGDTLLTEWLADTGRLLVTPHLPRRYEDGE